MQGQFRFSRRGVNVYQYPDLNALILDHLNRHAVVNYTGKLADQRRG